MSMEVIQLDEDSEDGSDELQKVIPGRDQNEETLEIEVDYFDLNVPWAQQAEQKSLNLGYKKQTIF